jgi:hypothetical protein
MCFAEPLGRFFRERGVPVVVATRRAWAAESFSTARLAASFLSRALSGWALSDAFGAAVQGCEGLQVARCTEHTHAPGCAGELAPAGPHCCCPAFSGQQCAPHKFGALGGEHRFVLMLADGVSSLCSRGGGAGQASAQPGQAAPAVLVDCTAPRPPSNLPAGPSDVIGARRDVAFQVLTDLCHAESPARAVLLAGESGAGKSQLALFVGAYALDRGAPFPGGVFFVQASALHSVRDLARAWLRELQKALGLAAGGAAGGSGGGGGAASGRGIALGARATAAAGASAGAAAAAPGSDLSAAYEDSEMSALVDAIEAMLRPRAPMACASGGAVRHVLLIIDGVRRLDQHSGALWAWLCDRLNAWPWLQLLVCGGASARGGAAHPSRSLGEGGIKHSVVVLEPLSELDSRAFVSHLLTDESRLGASDDLPAGLIRLCAGNHQALVLAARSWAMGSRAAFKRGGAPLLLKDEAQLRAQMSGATTLDQLIELFISLLTDEAFDLLCGVCLFSPDGWVSADALLGMRGEPGGEMLLRDLLAMHNLVELEKGSDDLFSAVHLPTGPATGGSVLTSSGLSGVRFRLHQRARAFFEEHLKMCERGSARGKRLSLRQWKNRFVLHYCGVLSKLGLRCVP